MPGLDVSCMVGDPLLADRFDVTRRADAVDSKGRTTPTPNEFWPGVLGVVTQEDPAKLDRTSDAQSVPRVIFIATMFPLRSVATGIQPDLITWDCTQYTVIEVKPYSRFGAGTYQAKAISMHATDAAAE